MPLALSPCSICGCLVVDETVALTAHRVWHAQVARLCARVDDAERALDDLRGAVRGDRR